MQTLRNGSEGRAELGEDTIIAGLLNVTKKQNARRAGLQVLPRAAALLAVFVHVVVLLRMQTGRLLAVVPAVTGNLLHLCPQHMLHVVEMLLVARGATTISSHIGSHRDKIILSTN